MSLGIQVEAAFRVWQVRWHHRRLRRRALEHRSASIAPRK
jgi:hypothetical protein